MKSFCILDAASVVVNNVVLDAGSAWEPPAGYTIGPDGGHIGQLWDGTTYTDPIAPAPIITIEQVVAERGRRLSLGFAYNFNDARGIHRIGTTPADKDGWDDVTKGAQAMINLGAGTSTLDVVTDTGPVTITATEWQHILLAATAFRQPIWTASFRLQAMNPIPADYAADIHWV